MISTTTTTATTMAATAPDILLLPLMNKGGGALDLQDVDRGPGRDDRHLVVRPGRPLLAADPDPARVRRDVGEHVSGLAHERRDPRPQRRPASQPAQGEGPDQHDPGKRDNHEDRDLQQRASASAFG